MVMAVTENMAAHPAPVGIMTTFSRQTDLTAYLLMLFYPRASMSQTITLIMIKFSDNYFTLRNIDGDLTRRNGDVGPSQA